MNTYVYSAGTGAIIFSPRGDEVLLIEEHKAPGQWGIVGGKLEPMSSLDNLAKEVLEETGLTVRVDHLVRVYHRFDCEPHRISFIYKVTALNEDRRFDASEVRRVKWFPLSAIPWDNLRFDDNRLMIRDAIETAGFPVEVITSLGNVGEHGTRPCCRTENRWR